MNGVQKQFHRTFVHLSVKILPESKKMALSNYLRHYEHVLEFKSLADPTNCARGMYVIPQPNWKEWQGVYFPTTGPYQGGIFRFQIDWNSTLPVIKFLSEVIHPLIHPGSLELMYNPIASTLLPSFPLMSSEATLKIIHLLWFIKFCFSHAFFMNIQSKELSISLDPSLQQEVDNLGKLHREEAVNPEAWDAVVKDYKLFKQWIDTTIQASISNHQLYEKKLPNNSIVFADLPESKLEEIKADMLVAGHSYNRV